MKISILVPSDEYKNYAGARIRYGRITSALTLLGHALELVDIAEIDVNLHECDVLIISKCYDARSLIVANVVSDRGKIVGIDLFDDYFSQSYDSRLSRFRGWLSQAVQTCHFALCSTEAMADVARGYRAGLPTHVMNDPAIDIQPANFAALLDAKLSEVRDRRQVSICWYGVGDNPHFPVGLADLSAFGEVLQHIFHAGYDVTLTVLTNRRALDAERLGMLRALPVKAIVKEWSASLELETLENSFACFLPVNAQNFSAAKSLNRAVTALTAGCQVISSGYPLYQSLDQLIYRRVEDLVRDIGQGDMHLSGMKIDQYIAMMSRWASPDKEAQELITFLTRLADSIAPAPAEPTTLMVVHGIGTNGGAHKLVQKLDGLSVALPYCTAKLGFDAMMIAPATSGDTILQLSRRGLSRLLPEAQQDSIPNPEKTERPTWLLGGRPQGGSTRYPLAVQLASYNFLLEKMCHHLKSSFPSSRILLSESSLLPVNLDTGK